MKNESNTELTSKWMNNFSSQNFFFAKYSEYKKGKHEKFPQKLEIRKSIWNELMFYVNFLRLIDEFQFHSWNSNIIFFNFLQAFKIYEFIFNLQNSLKPRRNKFLYIADFNNSKFVLGFEIYIFLASYKSRFL
jgi:hypothetical protein